MGLCILPKKFTYKSWPKIKSEAATQIFARNRDGNFTCGCGHPRILHPTGAGAAPNFDPWVDDAPTSHSLQTARSRGSCAGLPLIVGDVAWCVRATAQVFK